jgi:hypothetical protein
MAAKYDWGDGLGKVHTITLNQHKANVAAKGSKGKGKAPAGQPIVPIGTYDPGLDATLGQQTRGLEDLVGLAPNADTGTYGGTTGRDIGRLGRDLTRGAGYYDEDLATGTDRVNTGAQRSLDDLLKTRKRGDEDYKTNLSDLQRNYDILGTNQNANIRKAGVASGGAIQQAMDKRAANQAHDKAPIDLAYNRALDDSQTIERRLGDDKKYDLAQLQTTHDRGVGELGISTQRQIGDLGDTARIAIREGIYGGADIQAAKEAQFRQLYPGAKLPTTAARTTPIKSTPQQQQQAAQQSQAAAVRAHTLALTRARKKKAVI